ncbi:hypothetical protein B0H14DRAFT_1173115 [Mycena olivaceomarginata]|nr:hypothetical protein B0H14DRAFT_1173115 [Mycena olivaceomarginata]
MQRFPQELIDLVLDQVADSERDHNGGAWRRPSTSIATCGLVCKQWLPRSRLHVFSSMALFGSRLRSLLDLEAESSSLSLLSLARDLCLVFRNDFASKDMSRLRTCLSLTHLELCFPRSSTEEWDLFLGTHLPFLGAHCISLSSLKLSPCEKSAVSLRVIVDILVCLPSLCAFQLEGQSCRIIQAEIPLSQSVGRFVTGTGKWQLTWTRSTELCIYLTPLKCSFFTAVHLQLFAVQQARTVFSSFLGIL